MTQSENINELVAALAKAQLEYGPVHKDSENPYFNSQYADLATVIKATQPALAKHGLVVTQWPINYAQVQEAGVISELAHSSGQWKRMELMLPAVGQARGGGPKYDAQTVGTAITYARRYSYQAIVGVAAEMDDDANSIGEASGAGEASARAEADRQIAQYRARQSARDASAKAHNSCIMHTCPTPSNISPQRTVTPADRHLSQNAESRDSVRDIAKSHEKKTRLNHNTSNAESLQEQSEPLGNSSSASTYLTRDTTSFERSALPVHAISSHSKMAANRSASRLGQDTDLKAEKSIRQESMTQASTIASPQSSMEEKFSTRQNFNEKVFLTASEGGLVALSGPGLNIVRSEMTNDDRAFFGIVYKGNSPVFHEQLVFNFQDLCKRVGVEAVWTEPKNTTLPKAVIPPAPQFPNEPEPEQSTDPILVEAKEIAKEGKKPFMSLNWSGQKHSCFDRGVWPILQAAVGKPVMLETKANGKYSNFVKILRVDGISFAE